MNFIPCIGRCHKQHSEVNLNNVDVLPFGLPRKYNLVHIRLLLKSLDQRSSMLTGVLPLSWSV